MAAITEGNKGSAEGDTLVTFEHKYLASTEGEKSKKIIFSLIHKKCRSFNTKLY
jgi:hypothetical protein